jgi:hypothetical protein
LAAGYLCRYHRFYYPNLVRLGVNPKSAHAAKLSIRDSKREKEEIKNFPVLDVIRLQGFLKNVKVLGDASRSLFRNVCFSA